MDLLRAAIAAAGSQQEWAKSKGVDRATLNATLNGRRNLQPKVLQALGLEQVIVYRRLEPTKARLKADKLIKSEIQS
jgi:hypothetical protein